MNNKREVNCNPDGLGDLKEIKRLSSMATHAPKISWGAEFEESSIEDQLKYAKALASSMNHAADVLQQERNDLIKLAEQQELKLIASTKNYINLQEVVQNQMTASNKKQQELNVMIVDVTKKLKAANKRIKELENGNNDKLADKSN